MKFSIKKVTIAILLSSACINAFASNSWTQDEIIVKPKGADIFGNVMPNEMSYKFSYNSDELSAVNMLFKSTDSGNDGDTIYNSIVGSHYFKYENVNGRKRLKAIMLFSQGRERVTGTKDQITETYSLSAKAESPTFPMSGKWVLVVAERDEHGRATVVNKFRIGTKLISMIHKNQQRIDAMHATASILGSLYNTIAAALSPLDGIDFDDPSIGSPIGTFVITYTDQENTNFQEVKTYAISSGQCSACPAPPVKKPLQNYSYTPKISYVWDYHSNGDITTTFNYISIDAYQKLTIPFYQQELNVEDNNPDSGRIGRIMEYANNVYNLSHNAQPTPMYEYILKDESRESVTVDEYLFGLSMMGIGVPQEETSDINFNSIISSSPDSGSSHSDNLITNWLVEYYDKRFNGLGSLVSKMGSFGG
ncbi:MULTISPECIES: hypothetical protein [unclassified Pseudoalteromonas]|uniref:hypothetical protein n=1 Tax=unclassified Pseudoalteromonas TaxID=194690 RepID=UPI001601CB85|nr:MULTISPECIES: hypothetical protein [unclassified Pseudoalteromonas]MBB1331807.1 hypothetical protein [Pseudoalteromonas sp. SR41-6]MBB1459297.1 hypothetical protein [Pseudoalteromonas sp. SG41-8]